MISMPFKSFKDWRSFFTFIKEPSKEKIYVSAFSFDFLFINSSFAYTKMLTTQINSANLRIFNILSNSYKLWLLGLLSSQTNCLSIIDSNIITTKHGLNQIVSLACFLSGDRLVLKFKVLNSIISAQNIFEAFTWVERELTEFSDFQLLEAKDTRRLLTDYLQHSNINKINYKLNTYNILIQDLYMWVLQWLFFFSFCIILSIFSFFIFNSSLLHLILISELMIILLVLIMAVLLSYYNLYILIGLATLLLIFGGLELSLNLLFFTI